MNQLKGSQKLPEYIGKYKILEIIGVGGMGVIYKALQEPLNRIVALKVLPPHFVANEEIAARFEIEARAISLLQHHNIVNIYEYGNEGSYRFFAMQFVDGQNLSARIHQERPMPITQVIDFSKQICRGLRYAHALSVVHRDIKPANVVIDKHNVARLTDFGIAKIFSRTNITTTGVAIGTPEYMSPEQAEGNEVDTQTDIYSLGVVMYEMLTKTPPHSAENPIAVAYKHVHEIPLPPSAKRRDTPKRLELITLKALKKKKSERYESVAQMLEHLDSVDLDDVAHRPTVSFVSQAFNKPKTEALPTSAAQDKRITDRRAGERRRFRQSFLNTLCDKEFWTETLSRQWLSLVLFGMLSTAFILYILLHK